MTREVLIVVQRGDEFLVAHRVPEQGGYWHTIAGGVEQGEEWRDAAARELFEETGLAADLRELGSFCYTREAWEDESGLEVDVRAFATNAPPGWEPVLDDEHDEYRWCAADDAAKLLFWPEPARFVLAVAGR